MNVSLSKEIKEEIRRAAAKEHRSMSSFVSYHMSEYIKSQKKRKD